MPRLHLSLQVTHNCASTVPLFHLLDTGNAVTLPSGQGQCKGPPRRSP
uniref:Uncharacterized protein n=1 Tax=Rhizophora mucronata TaxID=61149 RepID=A0A2P2N0S6_RHIMU